MEEKIKSNQFRALSLNVVQYLKNIISNNQIYKYNKKCLCKNFLNNKPCKHYLQGTCKFAHSFFDLDEYYQFEILKMGFECFHYIYNNDYKCYVSNKKSISAYFENLKIKEKLYNDEVKNLDDIKHEYSMLIYYSYKLYKEQKLLIKKKTKFNELLVNTNLFTIYENIKEEINNVFTCKICYKPILSDNFSLENNDCNKFITLKCGHSICNNCHIQIINKENNTTIKCPICRNTNNINNTNPNYELNEILEILNTFFNLINIKIKTLQDNILKEERSKLFTFPVNYNNETMYITSNKKSYECPW